ncbi:hypothetical protein GCM10011338_34500 [Alteromonas lipolytica]|nr:hypothetical protein GCM10011338_34500 [Alteromonas lipolytica]
MIYRLAISFMLLTYLTSGQAQESWPTPAQIDLVKSRMASFPAARFIYDVDWYSPLEIVPGNDKQPLAVSPASSPAIAQAIALAEKHDSYAFIYWQGGAIRSEKYWYEFNAQSRFDTASMHKTVVAVLLGIAQQQGLINSVDDPVARYLPELAGTPRGEISLRAMLEMASGITTPPVSTDPASPYYQTYFGDDLKQAVAHWPMRFAPYEEFFYANANTQYLAWIIERTSQMRYADFLSEYLWKPLGAADARLWLDHEGGSPRASCCLQASARDWLKFGLLLLKQGQLNDTRIVPAEWIAAMTRPSATNPNYGWQIWRGSPHNPARIYGKGIPAVVPAKQAFLQDDVYFLDGSGGQRVYVIPSADMVIVRIGKADHSWDDSALPNLLLATEPTGHNK